MPTWSSTRLRRHRTTSRAKHDLGARPARARCRTVDKLRRLPVLVARIAGRRHARPDDPQRPVVFECVGVPGMIERHVPTRRCTRGSSWWASAWARPLPALMAVNKEVDLRFVVGYTPLEFRDTFKSSPTAKSIPRRCSPAPSGSTASPPPSRAHRPRNTRQDPHRPQLGRGDAGLVVNPRELRPRDHDDARSAARASQSSWPSRPIVVPPKPWRASLCGFPVGGRGRVVFS